MRALIPLVCAILAYLLFPASAAAQDATLTRLLRYPDASADRIVFVHGGDLWTVEIAGGMARRLTSAEGEELFPKFSPDGRFVAFTGQYTGSRQVYVIPVTGGTPKQLTFYNDVGELPPRGGVDNQVMGWTPDGKHVVFNAHRLGWNDRMTRPYIVPAAGGMETPLEIPEGGTGTFSPDGKQFAYAPISREFRTWKRYRGGRDSDIWIYDLANRSAKAVAQSPYTDHLPAWIGDSIYFASDRNGGKMNLWQYDTRSGQSKQVTQHTDFDVSWPSAGTDSVVYEQGGYIHRYEVASGRSARVPIQVFGDLPEQLPYFDKVRDNIASAQISPTGVRAVFEARGDLFTVPVKDGEPRNLTQSQGVRERNPVWSPDGRSIAYLSDRTGEYELYVIPQDGGAERQVTRGLDAWTLQPLWSPDSRKLAFGDKRQRLRYVDVASGNITECDQGKFNDISNFSWSPDSKWLAYVKQGETQQNSLWVYSLDSKRISQLTSGFTNDANPVFDPKGRYLYFTSNRDFNLTFSGFEFSYVYTNPARVYVAVLAQDGPALFLPKSDEEAAKDAAADAKKETADKDKAAKEKSADKDGADKDGKADAVAKNPVQVRIDVANFENRVRAIPGPAGNYGNLSATAEGVVYAVNAADGQQRIELYNIDAKEKKTILEGTGNYDLSADGKTFLYQVRGNWGIAPLKPETKPTEGTLPLDKLEMKVEPRREWPQMYSEAWRILRDWFYDPGMHGVNWQSVRERYEPWITHVASRADLDVVFAEIAGELNAGHVYVGSGELRRPKRVDSGLLGAQIDPDASGYFKISKIYPGENWQDDFRSPLTEPGVRAKVGELILAVDGRDTRQAQNFYELLEGKADRVVTLRLGPSSDGKGARDERVRPIARETNLRYLDWVQSRRAMVEKLSGGKIGYIHVPNTAVEGNRELFKYFYPQTNKAALLIDERYNGGGFIPDRMIELLNRPVLSYFVRRGTPPASTPGFAHSGPKAMLINGYSSSGGDALPYYFRAQKLGKLIGTRTWGGLIGLSGNPALVDGGNITVPTFRFMTAEGRWAVEGEGVSPDVEVVDRPDLVAQGQDPSLETAVKMLLDELKAQPVKPVAAPPVTVVR
jgi:tricorn protease